MSDNRSQGRKANDAGQSADATVRDQLAIHASLSCVPVKTLKAYQAGAIGFMGSERADFAEDVEIDSEGAFACPFVAHYVIRHRDWPQPLLLFVHSQNDGGSAENAVLRFLFNLYSHKKTPGVILLIGKHWEQPGAGRVAWVRSWENRRPRLLLRTFVGVAEFRAWIAGGMLWPESRQPAFA